MPLPTTRSEPMVDPDRLKVLIYGQTATGKSTFCSRPNNVLIIPFDDTIWHIGGFKYPTIITKWEQLKTALTEVQREKHSFRNIALDNMGRVLELCKEYIRNKYGVDHESDIPGFAKGYALVNDEFRRMMFGYGEEKLTGWLNLPCGVYMAAHEKEETVKTPSKEFTRIVPDLSPTPRGNVIDTCAFVFRAMKTEVKVPDSEEKTTRLWMLTKGDVWTYDGKDRVNCLQPSMNTSYPEFIKKVREYAEAHGWVPTTQEPAQQETKQAPELAPKDKPTEQKTEKTDVPPAETKAKQTTNSATNGATVASNNSAPPVTSAQPNTTTKEKK